MTTYKLDNRMFGKTLRTEYNKTAIGYAIVALRVLMGWVMFQGGIVKVLDPEWTAAGYLNFAIPEGNPFVTQFAAMAGNPAIDFLVAWGLTLTGLGLILGAFVRWNAFWAAFMMMMFWAASLHGGLAAGLPFEHGWVVDDHLIYAILLFAIGAFGAGRLYGFDAIFEATPFVHRNKWLKAILG